jgi:hypothetical protein
MMTFKLRSLAIVLLAVGFAGCASLGGGAAVDPAVGTWDTTVESPQGDLPMELLVNADLTGVVTAGAPLDGTFPMSEVVSEAGNLSFKITLEAQGQEIAAAISSTIEGDSITGTVATDFGDFPLTGMRRAE